MSFGGNADKETSKAMFKRTREAGINFYDCANMYNKGVAEEILGECIADCRDEIILTSKVHFPTGDDVNVRGLSRRKLQKHLVFQQRSSSLALS
jgi:aryl-alcohol dehydrogenase-like predicted oxidoreductase